MGSIFTGVALVCRLIVPEDASVLNPMARERCARGLAKTVRYPSNVLVHTWLGRRQLDAWVFNISRLDVPTLPCRIKARSHSCRLHASGGLGRLNSWHCTSRGACSWRKSDWDTKYLGVWLLIGWRNSWRYTQKVSSFWAATGSSGQNSNRLSDAWAQFDLGQ